MNLKFEKYRPHEMIKSMAAQLNESPYTDCLEEIIDLKKGVASGYIRGFDFVDGIGLTLFNCILEEDVIFSFQSNTPSPLQLLFCVEGQVTHQMNCSNIRYILNPLQGTISAGTKGKKQIITLPGRRKILFAMISIDRKKYFKKIDCIIDKMPDRLEEVFTDIDAQNPFFYQGNYSINSSSCIRKIVNDKNDGLARSTFIEAKVLELLSRQVKQFQDDLLHPEKQVTIRDYDLEKIKLAQEILVKDLQNPPIIKELAKLAGINQQKLKKGFKIVFDSTINNYLKNERLEIAATLLLKGNPVKEVSRTVGYVNQGHFAKRFKEKYGVLPKDYLKSITGRYNKFKSENPPKGKK